MKYKSKRTRRRERVESESRRWIETLLNVNQDDSYFSLYADDRSIFNLGDGGRQNLPRRIEMA